MVGSAEEEHALQTAWSIWELREVGKGQSYADKLRKLGTFRSVEQFWAYYQHIPTPSQALFDGYTRKKMADRTVESYAIFKDGITPEWEDQENKKGAEWSVRKEVKGEQLDEYWLRLVLGAIGETIDPGDEITGVRVIHKNRRDRKEPGNQFRYEIWLRSTDRARADEIRTRVMDVMNEDNPGDKWVPTQFMHKPH